MATKKFQFKNQGISSTGRKTVSFDRGISGLLFFSSLFVVISFFSLKIPGYLRAYKKSSVFLKAPQKKAAKETTHSVPLFVNLQGDKGPQLVRIHVFLSVDESSKTELLSQKGVLEKHILFLLSGQSAKALSSKKEHFEKQIHSHLNVFLSKKIVNNVHIQTHTSR